MSWRDASTSRERIRFRAAYLLFVLLIIEMGLFLGCLQSALEWVDHSFPGFLFLENRVVAAAGCPFWEALREPDIFHARLDRINGRTVRSAEEAWALIRSEPENTWVRYSLIDLSGKKRVERVTMTRSFGFYDFLFLFGAYFLNGILFFSVGAIFVWERPGGSSAPGFLAVGILASLWFFTACELYGPYRFSTLHILVESLLPAAFVHLACVFPEPSRRWKDRSKRWLPGLYGVFLAFGVAYAAVAGRPGLYSACSHVAAAMLGLSLALLLVRSVLTCLRGALGMTGSVQRILFALAMCGLGYSAYVGISLGLRGRPPSTYLAYTLFLLPVWLLSYGPWGREARSGIYRGT